MSRVAVVVPAMLCLSKASAEDYTFEISAGYDRTEYESLSQIIGSPVLGQGSAEFLSSSDTDALSLVGTWYLAGLSDDKGPRSRAALVDRASALSLSYRRADVSRFDSTTSTIPSILPGEGRFDGTSEDIGASARLASRRSGWFVQGSVLNSQRDVPFLPTSDDFAWNIGVGRYILDTTTLALKYGELEIGVFEYETMGLGVEHIGSLVGSWQYGVDFSYARLERDFGDFNDWRFALAIYPSRDIEFGVSYAEQLVETKSFSFFSPDEVESIEGFLSWFVTSNVELGAQYRVDEFASFENDDQDSFGLSLNVRF